MIDMKTNEKIASLVGGNSSKNILPEHPKPKTRKKLL